MSPADGADALLFTEESAAREGLLRVADGAAVACAVPRAGASRSQDATLVLPLGPDRAVLAIADGMGGLPDGGLAAARAVTVLAETVESAEAAGQSLQGAILDGIGRANTAVLELASGAATTLAVAELCGGAVRAYNIGDSEVMVLGQRGRLRLRTVSHSPVGFAVQAGLVDHEEALHHEDRHLVSNFLGSREMRIEVGSALRLGPMDTVLLCSDGLVDNLRLSEIRGIMRCGPLDARLRELASRTLERMEGTAPGDGSPHPSKPDDLSLVAFRRRPGRAVMQGLPPPRQFPLA